MTQQGLRQASVRAVTGTALDYNGDFSSLFTLKGIAAGDFNGRMLAWLNLWLSASYDNLPGAMAAFATANNATSFSAVGTFDAGAGGGGGGYVAKAVHSDGKSFLLNAALACAESPLYSMSFWSKTNYADISAYGFATIAVSDPATNYAPFSAMTTYGGTNPNEPHTGQWFGQIFKSTGGPNFDWDGENSSVDDDVWTHFLQTYDDTTRTLVVYKNDAPYFAYHNTDTPGSDPLYGNGLPIYVLTDLFGGVFIGDIADLMIMPGVSLLSAGDIPEATRRLFIDASGKPVNPATAVGSLGTPAILLSGDASTFGNNQGDGGSFALFSAFVSETISAPGPGPISVPGLIVGQTVSLVSQGFSLTDVTANFESVITVNDEIQQTSGDFYFGSSVKVTVHGGLLTTATTSPSD